MDDNTESVLKDQAAACRMLSAVFLQLPQREQIEAMLATEFNQTDSEGYAELARYARECAGRDIDDVLLEISRERVLLVRGMGEKAIMPPYESLYLGCEPNASIGGLNRFYAQAGLAMQDDTKDTSDQIGVELACLAHLCERELEALSESDDEAVLDARTLREHFYRQHIGRWAYAYADAVIDTAETGYWRAIGKLLKEVVL